MNEMTMQASEVGNLWLLNPDLRLVSKRKQLVFVERLGANEKTNESAARPIPVATKSEVKTMRGTSHSISASPPFP